MEATRFDDDSVQFYLRHGCAFPALTEDEEIELSQHVLAKDEQAESAGLRLIEGSLRMVVSIAERYRDGSLHILDLIQAGNGGLLVALKTLAENSTGSFSTH